MANSGRLAAAKTATTMLLCNIAHLYHRSYRMWKCLPTTLSSINLSHFTFWEKQPKFNCYQVCTIGVKGL